MRHLSNHLRIIILVCAIVPVSGIVAVHAQLKLDHAAPNNGDVGVPFTTTLTGSGFDENTRVFLSLDAGNRAKLRGNVQIPGYPKKAFVDGSFAYVPDGDLQLVDISDPDNPTLSERLATAGEAAFVTVREGYAYVADGENGLLVVDVQNAPDMEIVGHLDTAGQASAVAVFGGLAVVADGAEGVVVADIGDPQNPSLLGQVDTPGEATGVAAAASAVFVADGSGGLQVVNIADPSNPSVDGSLEIEDCVDVFYREDVVYALGTELFIVDASSLFEPALTATHVIAMRGASIDIDGDRVYVVDGYQVVQIVDVTDPANPVFTGYLETENYATNVFVSKGQAFVSDGAKSLLIYDLDSLTSPLGFCHVPTPGFAWDVSSYGRYVYVADRTEGVVTLDAANPRHPEIVGSTGGQLGAMYLSFEDQFAYITRATFDGLKVVDISDPRDPFLRGSVKTESLALKLEVRDKKAYVCLLDGPLFEIVDLSNPDSPASMSTFAERGNGIGVSVKGSLAYLAGGLMWGNDYVHGLHVVDVSNPYAPGFVSSTPVGNDNVYSLAIQDYHAFLGTQDGEFYVVDISNPNSPSEVGYIELPDWVYDVEIRDNIAYAACKKSGIQIVDVETPSAPVLAGFVETPGEAWAVETTDEALFVADNRSGVAVVPRPMGIEPVSVNSSSSLEIVIPGLPVAGNYNLRVFNAAESHEISGAVHIFDSGFVEKAIIVAGGKGPQDPLRKCTVKAAHLAYNVLLARGFSKDRICYIDTGDDDVDGNGFDDDIYAEPTLENVGEAFGEWASDAQRLIVYLVDHGGKETFRLNEEYETLEATVLNGYFDDLQKDVTNEIILIYEACRSGTFLQAIKEYPEKSRVVITSASDENAYFWSECKLSFSYQFWMSFFLSSELHNAFITGKELMKYNQTSLLDADCDGTPNERDDLQIAKTIHIGPEFGPCPDRPEIKDFSEDLELKGETTASFFVGDIRSLDPISRVWAMIEPPFMETLPEDIPVTDSATASRQRDLRGPDEDGRYWGVYDGFYQKGDYKMIVFARDENDLIGFPVEIIITQLQDVPPLPGDVDLDGSVGLQDAVAALAVLAGKNAVVGASAFLPSRAGEDGTQIPVGLEDALIALRSAANIQ